jgi:signal transduction histidine kinase
MEEQLINAEILNLLNEKKEISHVLEQVALKLKNYLGCEALGIRIKDKQGNIPYAAAAGFNDKFLAKENFLCIRNDSCVCIGIIEGKYNPDLPFYTTYGSFFTDNLQSLTTVKDGMRTGSFRGECVRCGWGSLGVVPVRFAHQYFGVIHFVHREASAIQRKQVRFIENIASQIGLYIHSIAAGKEKDGEFQEIVQRIIHDLRSPLTSIKGFSELITLKYSDRLNDDVQKMVERISSNAEYIEHLIQGFGDFANSTGGAEEHPETIDLKEFVLNLVSEMDLPRKGEIEIKFEENVPLIEYPPFSLKRILSNLIGNAAKYTGDRTPVIEIGCEEKDIFYQLSVKDSGPGINADETEKIFYPLYRSREAANIRGSGLGLSICKKLVEKCGGTIWVYSDKGQGSTFYFTVPKNIKKP